MLYNFTFLMQLFRLPTSNLNINDLNSVSSLCRCIVTENDQASLYYIKKGSLITVCFTETEQLGRRTEQKLELGAR